MENNKICSKCETVNKNNSLFCVNCGTQLSQTNEVQNINNNVVVNDNNTDNSKINKLGIISLVLYFGGASVFYFLAFMLPESIQNYILSLGGLCPLAAIVLMIVGRVKYPTSKFLKIVMWIIIIEFILSLLAFIIFFICCYVTCLKDC